MQGYRVYFDGKKFVAESKPSTVECKTVPYDSTVGWCGGPDIAFTVAMEQNELIQKGQWIVQTCKLWEIFPTDECGNNMVSGAWYEITEEMYGL